MRPQYTIPARQHMLELVQGWQKMCGGVGFHRGMVSFTEICTAPRTTHHEPRTTHHAPHHAPTYMQTLHTEEIAWCLVSTSCCHDGNLFCALLEMAHDLRQKPHRNRKRVLDFVTGIYSLTRGMATPHMEVVSAVLKGAAFHSQNPWRVLQAAGGNGCKGQALATYFEGLTFFKMESICLDDACKRGVRSIRACTPVRRACINKNRIPAPALTVSLCAHTAACSPNGSC